MVSSLFGRDDEVKALGKAYELCFRSNKPQQHLALIHGSSGSGKTALATQTLRPLLAEQKGLFLAGKADATAQWSRPYAVFVSAFQQLIQQIENDPDRNGSSDEGMNKIQKAIVKEFVGDQECSKSSDDSRLLSSIIPGFEKILQKTRSSDKTNRSTRSGVHGDAAATEGRSSGNGTDAVARLRFLLSRLCRTVASQCPLVLFLDDIQWCDRASLKLLNSILLSSGVVSSTTNASSLMVVCAYRDDEEYLSSETGNPLGGREEKKIEEVAKLPLVEFLEECKASTTSTSYGLHLLDLSLKSLDETTLNKILSGVYGLPKIEFYSHFIFQVSSGNIYLALQCVRQLCDEGLLYRCEETNEWKWDFSQLQAQDDATAQFLLNPAFSDIVRHGITQLSGPTQHLLSVASCFGMEIEEDVLTLLFKDESDIVPSVAKALEEATDEGLIVMDPIIGRHAFAHDRVQQAAHALIDDVDALSFEVGYKLWKRCPSSTLRSKVFAIVTLLNKGQSPDCDGHMLPHDDCYAVARLNQKAGQQAVSIAAFSDATKYFEAGVALLIRGGNGATYWNDRYELTLDLLSSTAEVQMFNHNFERVESLVDEVCWHAKCLEDRYRVLMTRITAVSLRGRIQEAIDMGTDVLRQLGEKMPSRPTAMVMMSEIFRTKLALKGKSQDTLMSLPPMEAKEKIAAAQVINTMFYYSTVKEGKFKVLLAARSIRLCLRHGSFDGSPMSFTMYAFALCGMGNVEEGFRFGQLALSLLEQSKNRDILPRVHAFYYYGVHNRKRPLREGIEGFERGIRVGMEVGDVETAMINDSIMIHHWWWMGCTLQKADRLVMNGLSRRKVHNHPVSHVLLQILVQVIDRLAGRRRYVNLSDFVEAVDEQTSNNKTDLKSVSFFYHGALLAYIFRDYEAAHEMLGRITPALGKTATSTLFEILIAWIHGLTSLAVAREGVKRRENMAKAKRLLKKVSKWAQDCPSNYGHMHRLLKAEYESTCVYSHNCAIVTTVAVLEHYDFAMEESLKEGFLYVAALAAERAGDCMMRLGDADSAHKYWEKAHSHYQEWGATGKARTLATLKHSVPAKAPSVATLMESFTGQSQVLEDTQ